jgi:hypothetical protein
MLRSRAEGTTMRWGKAHVWWQQTPEMDLDRWGVLTTLALYADDQGLCYPSQATIARALKKSRPWVNRVIGELADLGFIEKTARTRSSNAGTTSCEYRVISDPLEFASRTGRVTSVTSPCQDQDTPCPANDTPCHHGDTTQSKPKQNKLARPAARDPSEKDAGRERSHTELEPVPVDWAPSANTLNKARTISPNEDLEAHAVMFANRSRSKGYVFARGRVDEAWLGWLAEDRVKNHRKGRCDSLETPRPGVRASREPGARRFAAWAAAAAAPKMRAGVLAPGRPEGENPWR